jgi:hypothetical protein
VDKFQRHYKLEVEGGDGDIYTFADPLTLQFNIQRAALASTNTANLRLLNLSQNTRKAIYKDTYSNIGGPFRSVKLWAGYGDNLVKILDGHSLEAKSYREEGAVNFTTEISVYDWSFAMTNTRSDWTIGPPDYTLPISRKTVINKLIDDLVLQGVGKGVVSDFSTYGTSPYARPYVASGSTWDILRSETNDHCFIDNGTVHCLLDDDYLQGDILVIDASTGLLSTPKKSEYKLKIDLLFEPTVKIGQMVDLNSMSESLYNGQYKIIGIQHSGIISGAESGRCKTSLELNAGELELQLVSGNVTRTPLALTR